MDKYKEVFERVAVVDVATSSALLSGLTTVAMCTLVGVVTLSAFKGWSDGSCDEGQALTYVMRSIAMLFLLTAMMIYMRQAS